MSKIANFFKPRGVAIIGASADPQKLSNGILVNMLSYGYTGKIYPVNPKNDTILDLPCYPSITEVPDPVDMAVVILPSQYILPVIDDCGKRGIQSVVIISGGFKETGAQGLALENEVLKVAKKYEMRIVGPNCVGTVDLYSGLNCTFINGIPTKGGVAFISQSGAVIGAATDYLLGKGVGFSHFVSLGNEADITETDMIEYLGEDEHVSVIVGYVESIMQGPRFIQAARKVAKKKPIVLLKSGRSEAGARAVSSHTGSLAGSQEAYQAAFHQAGVIQVDEIKELYALASGFSNQPLPKGNRVAIVTNAGGGGALASDALEKAGLVLATFSPETVAAMRPKMNPASGLRNPVDMLGGASPAEYEIALEHVLADPNVDAVLPIIVPTSLVDTRAVAEEWVKAAQKTNKPMLCCLMGEASLGKAMDYLHDQRIPVFTFPEEAAATLGKMYAYAKLKASFTNQNASFTLPQSPDVANFLAAQNGSALGEHETRTILTHYQFPLISGGMAKNTNEALQIANEIGYPVVLKIVSPQILHKSDAGGIQLNLKDDTELREGLDSMQKRIHVNAPDAEIQGFLIEKMAPKGMEVIIGMKRDPNFGPLIMFGMGGIFVELFKDIAFGVAPLSDFDVNRMIESTKAGTLLKGYRGGDALDLQALKESILKLAALAINHPEILEIEINPMLILPEGQGALALDARAILEDA